MIYFNFISKTNNLFIEIYAITALVFIYEFIVLHTVGVRFRNHFPYKYNYQVVLIRVNIKTTETFSLIKYVWIYEYCRLKSVRLWGWVNRALVHVECRREKWSITRRITLMPCPGVAKWTFQHWKPSLYIIICNDFDSQ